MGRGKRQEGLPHGLVRGSASPALLSRDAWREAVFTRDGRECVICSAPAVDAHHIIERKLWPDGGYFVDNGASLCAHCHLRAERTLLSCEELREAAGIMNTLLPPQFELDEQIDKWGNRLGTDGRRYPGELFYEEQVQKVLGEAKLLDTFSTKFKHPRTPHLPGSPGATADDIELVDLSVFEGREVVVTSKLDGECTTIGRTVEDVYCHARSLDSGYHPSRTWVRGLAPSIGWELPIGWRVVGENLQAVHSVRYHSLPGYFLAFAVINDRNEFLSWAETEDWCHLLGISTVPVLYRGLWDEDKVRACWPGKDPYTNDQEGYVVRLADSFPYRHFGRSTAKFVRADHVQTDQHWLEQEMVENELRPPPQQS